MFSASLEAALTIAYREAASRRHADLTARAPAIPLAHDSDGERICRRAARSALNGQISAFQRIVEQFTSNRTGAREKLAFRRVCRPQCARQSRRPAGVQAGDIRAGDPAAPRRTRRS